MKMSQVTQALMLILELSALSALAFGQISKICFRVVNTDICKYGLFENVFFFFYTLPLFIHCIFHFNLFYFISFCLSRKENIGKYCNNRRKIVNDTAGSLWSELLYA